MLLMRGLVIKSTGSWYTVRTDDGRDIESKIKGNFRLKDIKSTNPIAVGDRVVIDMNSEGTAFISSIEERKNYIIRRASNLSKQAHIIAANLDQAMLIVTVNYPITTTIFMDRFLATAMAYRIPVKLVFNKTDRYNMEDRKAMEGLIELYTSIGYPCSTLCARSGEGLEALRGDLRGDLRGHRFTSRNRHPQEILRKPETLPAVSPQNPGNTGPQMFHQIQVTEHPHQLLVPRHRIPVEKLLLRQALLIFYPIRFYCHKNQSIYNSNKDKQKKEFSFRKTLHNLPIAASI